MNSQAKRDFDIIISNSHVYNWAPDLQIVREIYEEHDESFAVLTPFMYTYLEELIRSFTPEYGMEITKPQRKTGRHLLELASKENENKPKLTSLLNELRKYYSASTSEDCGNNRNSVMHGYMHPRYWTKKSFEQLVHDIARLSRYV